MNTLIAVIAFGPSALLIGWALYAYFFTSDPAPDDFMERRDDWGAF